MYTEPDWRVSTSKSGSFEVMKEGRIIESIPISAGINFLSFGRLPDNNIQLDHDSISRNHAILQFGPRNSAFIFDLGSTHGTFLNKKRVPSDQYVKITSGNSLIQFGASTRIYLLNLEETLPEESMMKLETKVSFGKCILSFFESHDIPINAFQFVQNGNIISCSLNFSDFLSIDSSERSRITSSGITKEEALEKFYEDCFDFLSRLNLIEKQSVVSDSEIKSFDDEFSNETSEMADRPSKEALSEQQLLSLKNQFQNEFEIIKSQIEKLLATQEVLNQEIVEDFDVYVQDLKKAELTHDIEKLQIKLDIAKKVMYLHI